MNFKFVHKFNCNTAAFEEITHTCDPSEYIEEMPNLREREPILERIDGKYVHRVYRNFAVGQIPREMRRFVKPKMLSWLEESVYDIEKKTFDWNIKPYYFSDIFTCKGTYTYIDESPILMRREIAGLLEIKAPLIGDAAERFLYRRLKENLETEYRVTSRIIERRFCLESARALPLADSPAAEESLDGGLS